MNIRRVNGGTDLNKARWRAVASRARVNDGQAFVYAVKSTGIYCRPACASRRPRREHVEFFDTPADAERNGYRACRRCRPKDAFSRDPIIERVRGVCDHIEKQSDQPLNLNLLARGAGITPDHLQRQFKRVLGITPARYLEAVRLKRVRAELRSGRSVTDAIFAAGYSASSRLYERSAGALGMTPATYRKNGQQTFIRYTTFRCPLGTILIAATKMGICSVTIGDSARELIASLKREFAAAEFSRGENDAELSRYRDALRRCAAGSRVGDLCLPLDVRCTAFQHRVWRELQKIPPGQTRTYRQIARDLRQPEATRAVARACASNPTALIIPCHRVIRTDGALGGYRWGLHRKQRLLTAERR